MNTNNLYARPGRVIPVPGTAAFTTTINPWQTAFATAMGGGFNQAAHWDVTHDQMVQQMRQMQNQWAVRDWGWPVDDPYQPPKPAKPMKPPVAVPLGELISDLLKSGPERALEFI